MMTSNNGNNNSKKWALESLTCFDEQNVDRLNERETELDKLESAGNMLGTAKHVLRMAKVRLQGVPMSTEKIDLMIDLIEQLRTETRKKIEEL
jgi:hypothetical protein